MDYIILIFVVLVIIIALVYCNKIETMENISSRYADAKQPYIKPFIINDLLTADECKQIIEYSKDKLIESEVVGGTHKSIRNSKQYWISKNEYFIAPIFEKISNMFNIPVENAEDLQVVRYQPDQYYNEHHDSCCDDSEKCTEFIKRGGQRKLTILIYLNQDFENGQTEFKNLNIKIKAKPGSAIAFFPLANNSNKCHPLALHAGLPVTKGEKWIANLWFRESKFT